MAREVEEYYRRCVRCNTAKPTKWKNNGPAGILCTARPFDIVSIDFTNHGSKRFWLLLVSLLNLPSLFPRDEGSKGINSYQMFY